MQFTLTDEQRMIQETAREFADSEIAPVADRHNREGKFPLEIVKKLGKMGFLGMTVPEQYGGSHAGNLALVIALEEINRVCASTGVTMSVQNSLVNAPLLHWGSDDVKGRYLPRLATGEFLGAYALSEPGSGSDAAGLVTSAVRDGNDYVLNGTKNFITTGKEADVVLVLARTDTSHKTRGITAFVIDAGTPGFSVGKKEDKLGLRASSTVQLILEDARVPAANILGEVGGGFKIAMHTLDGGRIGIAAQAVGIAEACLQASVKYAGEREAFDQPIGKFQAIQFKIADMATRVEAARLLVYNAARLKDEGLPHGKEAAMAKLFASESANAAAREAVQIHGGAGYLEDFPVERYFRDARITEIYEGTSEIQRIVIARHILKNLQ
ncbi:MAG TPA: acyl-CoA dehydrogenase [Candidatus Krumholzibacteria bacterium]|nr:acyl-CoA dehydrogenase [Candidatus Krumholzibacteria bacterium]